jgi:hypothetical protein
MPFLALVLTVVVRNEQDAYLGGAEPFSSALQAALTLAQAFGYLQYNKQADMVDIGGSAGVVPVGVSMCYTDGGPQVPRVSAPE